jgi:prevent-host-death family protein
MDTATITEVKNGLSAILDRVRAGTPVLVTDRGVPVAVIEPVTSLVGLDERLLRLERAGIVTSEGAEPPVELLRTPPPRVPGASLVTELLHERAHGR